MNTKTIKITKDSVQVFLLQRNLKSDDIPAALALINKALGVNYWSFEALTLHLHQGNPLIGVYLGSRLLAVIIGANQIKAPAGALDSLELLDSNLVSPRTAMLCSLVVDEEFRGYGLGSTLTQYCSELLFSHADRVIGFGWTDHEGCHAEAMLLRLGYQVIGDLPNFWREELILTESSCPSCTKLCACTARIFVK